MSIPGSCRRSGRIWTKKGREKAVTQAIQDCIREGIFADLVKKHGSEAEKMLFPQFNIDDALGVLRER